MGKAKPAGIGPAIGERIEQQQQAALVASARRKLTTGETLTTRETGALKKFEQQQLEKYGHRYFAEMPKGDYARIIGRQSGQLLQLADRYGFPYLPNQPVDVGKILRWFHEYIATNGAAIGGGDPIDRILPLASKELKDDYVREQTEGKRLDNERKRMEISQLNESRLPIEPIRQFHNEIAGLLRSMRMRCEKRFEGDNKEFISAEFEGLINGFVKLGDAHFNDSSEDITEDLDPAAAVV